MAVETEERLEINSGSVDEKAMEEALGTIVVRKDTAYASTKQNMTDEARIDIPNDHTYRDHTSREWTGRGGRSFSDGVIRRPSDQKVIAVWLKVEVKGKRLFGRNNWIGRELSVTYERTS